MTSSRKWMMGAVGALILTAFVPIAYTALSARSLRGYFKGGRCACGNDTFIRLEGDGYFQYSPGHGMPERRLFTIRPQGAEWEVLGLPHSDEYWSPLAGEDKVIARLRFQDGALYESWNNGTNWTRHAPVYNPYPIWIAKLMNH